MAKDAGGERGRQNLSANKFEACWNRDAEPPIRAIYLDSVERDCLRCRNSILGPNRSFNCRPSTGIPYWLNSYSLHFGKAREVCKSA